jgi:lipooligosaccharide transport system permease protein
MDLRLPHLRRPAFAVVQRNFLVWRKLFWSSLLVHFGEPLLYLLGFGYGLGLFVGELEGMSYLAFLASGIVASSAMQTASFEGMYSVFTRMSPQRTYEAILATPLDVDDIISGELLWCALKSLTGSVAILITATLLGVVTDARALLVLPVVFLTALCFSGPAILMAALARNYDFFNYYVILVITPMLMLSGVFFPLDALPTGLRVLIDCLPLTHAVALIRPLMTGHWPDALLLHLTVLVSYTGISFYLAVIAVRRRLLV